MLKTMILAAVVTLSSSAALAADPVPQKANDKDKRICRRVDDTAWRTGSKMICMSKAEWAQEDQVRQHELEADRNRGSSGVGDESPLGQVPRA
jgi:hypothetical protein